MGGKGSAKTRVTEYRMSFHFGIGLPVDKITALYHGEKIAWSGELSEQSVAFVNRIDLHGGIKEEGGLQGLLWFLPGDKNQVMPEPLAQRLGRTSSNCVAFRGLSSFWLTANPVRDGSKNKYISSGANDILFETQYAVGGVIPKRNMAAWLSTFSSILTSPSRPRGAYIAANNPYLKTIWVTTVTAPKGLDPDKAMIGQDANPAHIIYECLVDRTFGAGVSPQSIDRAEFEQAASTLYDEGFGLSLAWTGETDIETFIGEILNHIRGVVFIHPENGKLTLRLFRDDYDVETLRVIDMTNARKILFERKSLGETINQITITYTQREDEGEASVTFNDLANAAAQGAVISDTRNYYGVRDTDLVEQIGSRDIAEASYPLATAKVETTRGLWDLEVGEVVKYEWEDDDVGPLIMRVVDISQSSDNSRRPLVTLVEDIFSIISDKASIATGTAHVDTSKDPEPATSIAIQTVPAYFLVTSAGIDIEALEYPSTYGMHLVGAPNTDTFDFGLHNEVPTLEGGTEFSRVGTYDTTSTAELIAGILPEAITTVSDFNNIKGYAPVAGDFLLFGSTEETSELVLISAYNEDGYTLRRGVFDTIPRTWSTGTPFFVIRPDSIFIDETERGDGIEEVFRITPKTSRGELFAEDVADQLVTFSDRPYRPLRPSNVKANDTLFLSVDGSDGNPVVLSWSTRNRLVETGAISIWTDASSTPEEGQTTTIRIVRTDNSEIIKFTGITDTTYTIEPTDFGGETSAKIEIYSERDGYESLQKVVIAVNNIAVPSDAEGMSGDEDGSILLSGDAQPGKGRLLLSGE